MAAKGAGGGCPAWYRRLLRLYPRVFRERFAESMAQTYQDLRRANAPALWIFFETLTGIAREHTAAMTQTAKTVLRVAFWSLVALMAPLVGSQVVEGWNWPARAFVVVYCLFFAVGMVYAVVARRMSAWSYKAGAGLALAAGFALGWSNMVHVADSGNPANLIYYSVLAVGLIGACLARLQARTLAWTLFAMAATLAGIALVLPSGAPPEMARNMAVGHAVLVVLFMASGLLFRRASVAGTASAGV